MFAAFKAGVVLEINDSMHRLDLTDVLARTAQGAGSILAIGSAAHSRVQMDQIRYGVHPARRGLIEPRSVVNTWPVAKLHRCWSGTFPGAAPL